MPSRLVPVPSRLVPVPSRAALVPSRPVLSVLTRPVPAGPRQLRFARDPPCHELVSTKSCSTLTLLIVTFVVWKTVSLTLAMMRYWPAASGQLVAAGSPGLGGEHLAGLEVDRVDLYSALALTRLIEVGAAAIVVGDANQLRLRKSSCGRSPR